MKTTRKRYSADFKAKKALEAIRGDLTLAELAAKHGVHHTMIAAWKRQVIDEMAGTFSGDGDAARSVSGNEVEKLDASKNYRFNARAARGVLVAALAA